jgi:hypothetical protein
MEMDTYIDFALVENVEGMHFEPHRPKGIEFIPAGDDGGRGQGTISDFDSGAGASVCSSRPIPWQRPVQFAWSSNEFWPKGVGHPKPKIGS